MSNGTGTALAGLAGFLGSTVLGYLMLTATGGAGTVEVAMMTVLACVIGVSVAVVHRRRAMSRVTDGG